MGKGETTHDNATTALDRFVAARVGLSLGWLGVCWLPLVPGGRGRLRGGSWAGHGISLRLLAFHV